jgi:glycerol-3-phosphate dehydrogenase
VTSAVEATIASADRELREAMARGDSPGVVIVGGGITGAAIFAKAAAAGLQPWLVERGDFASGTSSRSSKMLHGGLRYLASGDLKTVRQSAAQKNWFSQALPDHVHPLPFFFLHRDGEFPSARIFDWVLSVYDRISKGKKHRRIARDEFSKFAPGFNLENFNAANLYYDAVTDDVALVHSLLLTGVQHGGLCANYLPVDTLLTHNDKTIGVKVTCQATGEGTEVLSSMVVNATGAWANKLHPLPAGKMLPLRGSHIVLPGWKVPVTATLTASHPDDGRPVYVYPWQGMTVVGCTDLLETADLELPTIMSSAERDYLLTAVQSLGLRRPIDSSDIVSSWSGIRPVISPDKPAAKEGEDTSPSKEPRNHQIWQTKGLISIAGGKLATAMPMADDVLNAIAEQRQVSITIPDNLILRSWRQVKSLAELETEFSDGAIKNLEDLLIRSTRLGFTMGEKLIRHRARIEQICIQNLQWSPDQFEQQWQDFWLLWQQQYGPSPSVATDG